MRKDSIYVTDSINTGRSHKVESVNALFINLLCSAYIYHIPVGLLYLVTDVSLNKKELYY